MATNIISNPFPLGIINPGANFASASVAITSNYTDLTLNTSPYYAVDSIYVKALAGNSGSIYLLNSSAQPDTTLYSNVLDVIAAGGFTAITSAAMNTIVLRQFYIGAGNSTDSAIVLVKFR